MDIHFYITLCTEPHVKRHWPYFKPNVHESLMKQKAEVVGKNTQN